MLKLLIYINSKNYLKYFNINIFWISLGGCNTLLTPSFKRIYLRLLFKASIVSSISKEVSSFSWGVFSLLSVPLSSSSWWTNALALYIWKYNYYAVYPSQFTPMNYLFLVLCDTKKTSYLLSIPLATSS